MCVSYFRAIFFPFKPRLQTRLVVLVTLLVAIASVATRAFGASRCILRRRVIPVRKMPVYVYSCSSKLTAEEKFTLFFIKNAIGLWLPITIVTVLHIAMYLKLKKQARIRAQCTSGNTTDHMQRTLKIFVVVVLAFIICTFPLSVLKSIKLTHREYYFNSILLIDMHNFCIFLMAMNNCLNPFIYSKIHLRIYRGMKVIKDSMSHLFTTISRRVEKVTSQQQSSSESESIPRDKKEAPMGQSNEITEDEHNEIPVFNDENIAKNEDRAHENKEDEVRNTSSKANDKDDYALSTINIGGKLNDFATCDDCCENDPYILEMKTIVSETNYEKT